MKKSLYLVLPLLAALLFGLYQGAYLQVGQWLYKNAMHMEANLYGFDTGRADIGEMKLAYYWHANPGKPTLVMLHGYSADKDVWLRFARHFTSQYQVLIPDLAGHGDSPFDPTWNYGMPAQAQRLHALLEKLHIEKAHLIGNSMGGFLTATYAIRYPEHTASIVLMDAAGVLSPTPSDLYKMLEKGRNPFLVHNRKEFDEFFAMTMHQPPFMPGAIQAAVAHKYQERRTELEKIFNDFSQSDYVDKDLNKIQVPTMIWWGDHDRLLDVSAVPLWLAGIPQAKAYIFKDIGHMPMMETPNKAAKVYQAFLDELR